MKSVKRCLRKTIGKASLSYDELATMLIEVEAVVNSRPLTYVTTDDLDEPLTPSHLLTGRRILSLLYPASPKRDEDYDVNNVGPDQLH